MAKRTRTQQDQAQWQAHRDERMSSLIQQMQATTDRRSPIAFMLVKAGTEPGTRCGNDAFVQHHSPGTPARMQHQGAL